MASVVASNGMRGKNSEAAAAWAQKRKEQMARAVELKELRNNLNRSNDEAAAPALPQYSDPPSHPRQPEPARQIDFKALARQRIADAEAAIAAAEEYAMQSIEHDGFLGNLSPHGTGQAAPKTPPAATRRQRGLHDGAAEQPVLYRAAPPQFSRQTDVPQFSDRMRQYEEHLAAIRSRRGTPGQLQREDDLIAEVSRLQLSHTPADNRGARHTPPWSRATSASIQQDYHKQDSAGRYSRTSSMATIGWAGPWMTSHRNNTDHMYPAAHASDMRDSATYLHSLSALPQFDPTAPVSAKLRSTQDSLPLTEDGMPRLPSACQWNFGAPRSRQNTAGSSAPPAAGTGSFTVASHDQNGRTMRTRRAGAEPASAGLVPSRDRRPRRQELDEEDLFGDRQNAAPRVGRRAASGSAAAGGGFASRQSNCTDAAKQRPDDGHALVWAPRRRHDQMGASKVDMHVLDGELAPPESPPSPPRSAIQDRAASTRIARLKNLHKRRAGDAGQGAAAASPPRQSPEPASAPERDTGALAQSQATRAARAVIRGNVGDSQPSRTEAAPPPAKDARPQPQRSQDAARGRQSARPSQARTAAASNNLEDSAVVGSGPNVDFEAMIAQQLAAEDAATGGSGPMKQCGTCGRSFNAAAFDKHVRVCEKVFVQKRKKMDMKAVRLAAAGVEGASGASKKAPARRAAGSSRAAARAAKPSWEEQAAQGAAGKKADWKKKSEQFRAAMRANRQIQEAEARGEDIRNIPVFKDETDDRVSCPHCGRKFAALTAERHIPKCKDIKAKPSFLKRGGGAGGGNLGKARYR